MGIEPISVKKGDSYFDHYIVPFENAGYEYAGVMAQNISQGTIFPNMVCNHITIVTEAGTNRLKTAFPSSRTANFKVRRPK